MDKLKVGLPRAVFDRLRTATPLGRLAHHEAEVVFDELHKAGYVIAPKSAE